MMMKQTEFTKHGHVLLEHNNNIIQLYRMVLLSYRKLFPSGLVRKIVKAPDGPGILGF